MIMEEGKPRDNLLECSTKPMMMETDDDLVGQRSHVKTPIKIGLIDLASNVSDSSQMLMEKGITKDNLLEANAMMMDTDHNHEAATHTKSSIENGPIDLACSNNSSEMIMEKDTRTMHSLLEDSTKPIAMDAAYGLEKMETSIKKEPIDVDSNIADPPESENDPKPLMSVCQGAGVYDRHSPLSEVVPLEGTACTAKSTPTLPSQDISSLSVIANYGSDSYESDDDDNSNCNSNLASALTTPQLDPAPIDCPTDYRTIQASSEDSDSDSSKSSDDDSSSSSSSGSSNEAGQGAIVRDKKPVIDDNFAKKKKPGKGGEIALDDLPPIADLQISVPENSCQEMGFISSIVEQQVVVQAKTNFPPLNLDTVLFLDHGQRPLGVIFDVLGPVSEPLYTVRFNSADHVKDKNIKAGMSVFCAPDSEHTNFVFVDELLKLKASDPGWDDTEPPPDCLDFSDDEAERNSHASKSRSNSTDWDLPPRKRVNSFERRMNERNLRKSALPPEPQSLFTGFMRAARARRGRNQPSGFAQPRASRPAAGPVFPSPTTSGSGAAMYQPRPVQQAWDDVHAAPPTTQPPPMRAAPFAGTRGYCFPPPSTGYNPFCLGMSPDQARYRSPPSQAATLALVYSMGANNPMYPSGYPIHNNQRQPFPVLLRPASFAGTPARFDSNSYGQSMPFSTPPPAFPPCFPSGPPQPPMRGQPYNPMFSGLPMFNPGFPPPQMHPRSNIYPAAPPPPPRGGV